MCTEILAYYSHTRTPPTVFRVDRICKLGCGVSSEIAPLRVKVFRTHRLGFRVSSEIGLVQGVLFICFTSRVLLQAWIDSFVSSKVKWKEMSILK